MEKSYNNKFWLRKKIDNAFVNEISRMLGISDFIASLIAGRVKTLEEAELFLDPKIKTALPDPFHLKDMELATQRVHKAILNQEKICIFADYDVDGATSSALLKNIFTDLGLETEIYVPDRILEGYGPNNEAFDKIKQNKCSLIITVDCGSVAFEALEHANKIGLEVIVIDHHLSLEKLPHAVAVLNPNRLDQISNCKNLAAVGVAFLFVTALISYLKKQEFFINKKIPNLLSQLDLVALGTVCDVMKLSGLNRAFVTQGLKITHQRGNLGYCSLSDIAGIDEMINCYHLGFIIGPRINAGGRVGKASLGSTLLSTNDRNEARAIASELDEYNQARKILELEMLETAKTMAETQRDNAMIFVYKEGWHPGVIGIVAGRLKEFHNKPVAVIALNKGIGKASCRSVSGIDFGGKIIEAKNHDLIIAGGGHEMAAGFSVEESKISALQEFLDKKMAKDLEKSNAHLIEYYDQEIVTQGININLFNDIEQLAPFGNGNPAPVFKVSGLFVLKADIVGLKHIKLLLAPDRDSFGKKSISAIMFNGVGTNCEELVFAKKSNKISIYGNLKLNKWNGRETVQFHVKDMAMD